MSPIHTSSITLRTILIYGFFLICFAAFVVYVLFQARFMLAGPQITVETMPQTQTERLITLKGQAKNIINMTLNGRQIYTDKNGHFTEALVLENGYTVTTLRAKDRYGRTTTHTQSFVFKSKEPAEEVVIN